MSKVTRRDAVLGGSALALAATARGSETLAPRRPNIIWIVCHDIHAPLLGCYGNPLARTPSIDALGTEGVRYDNAFTVAPVCAPSRFSLLTGVYPQSCAPAHQMRANGPLPAALKTLPQFLRAAGYYCTNNVFTDFNADIDPAAIFNEWSAKAHWRNRPAGAPFFCVYNYLITHESRLIEPGTPQTDPAKVRVPQFLPDLPQIRESIARNIDMVNRQDAAVAHLLGELEEDGLAQDTIVFFLADHGGLHPRSKRYCYDDGLRIPMLVRVPAKFREATGVQAGTVSKDLVSHVDMAPTVLALAGLQVPATMMGHAFLARKAPAKRDFAFSLRDRMDERYDLVHTVRDGRYRYLRNYDPHRIYGQYQSYEWQLNSYQTWERAHLAGTLTPMQSAFWKTKPSEELYDTLADPDSVNNLVDDPAHRKTLQAMRRALDAHILSIRDGSFVPEGAEMEGYDAARKADAYPLEKVLEVANLSIRRDATNVGRFVRGIADPQPLIRFWSARGIMLVSPMPSDALHAVEARVAVETVPWVRTALAEALVLGGRAGVAREALVPMLSPDSAIPSLLRSLNALTLMAPGDAAPARPRVERLAQLKDEYVSRAAKYLLARIDGTYTPAIQIVTGAGGGGGARAGGAPAGAAPPVNPFSDPQI